MIRHKLASEIFVAFANNDTIRKNSIAKEMDKLPYEYTEAMHKEAKRNAIKKIALLAIEYEEAFFAAVKEVDKL